MALSCSRFFRFLRSVFAPAAAIIGFSCLLTIVFILYQPTPGPGIVQRLGWQSWDAVTTVDYFEYGSQQPEDAEDPGSTSDQPTNPPPADTDWWDTVNPGGDTTDISSYPTDVWAPLLPHDTGCEYGSTSFTWLLKLMLWLSVTNNDHQMYCHARTCWRSLRARNDGRAGRNQGQMGSGRA
jgi:hypothetical protein